MPMLEELQLEAPFEWADMERIACVTGPGSFTGLRVGLATARGLALALKIPCIGVTVFEAFAARYGGGRKLGVVMDARRGQVWMQIFDENGRPTEDPRALGLDEAVANTRAVQRLAGSGAPLLAKENVKFDVVTSEASPPIEQVAEIAFLREQTAAYPSPLYLRLPDAKRQKDTASAI